MKIVVIRGVTAGPKIASKVVRLMPTAKPLLLKLVVDTNSRRLLGAQGTGPGTGDKRIDVAV